MHGSKWRREETRPVGPARAARSRRLSPTLHLLLGQRSGERVGVILFADEQVPEQLCHLAAGRDDRDRMAAAGPDALIEGAQRSG
jgi:hypothetical protein